MTPTKAGATIPGIVAMVFETPNKIPEKEPDISLMFTK